MKDLAKRIEELEALLKAALTRIEELEVQLRQISGNSSKPPSSDIGRRKVPKAATGRKDGGQLGHPGTTRDIAPPEQVDEEVDMDPETCANCGTPLEQAPRIGADIRQIVETPAFQTFVRDFWLWKKRCPKCGGFTQGKMPPGSPRGAYGPRIQVLTALLSGRFRLSRREVHTLMRLMAGVYLCAWVRFKPVVTLPARPGPPPLAYSSHSGTPEWGSHTRYGLKSASKSVRLRNRGPERLPFLFKKTDRSFNLYVIDRSDLEVHILSNYWFCFLMFGSIGLLRSNNSSI